MLVMRIAQEEALRIEYVWKFERKQEGHYTKHGKLGRAQVNKIREVVGWGQITWPQGHLSGLGTEF